jgi:hypothetical protein
MPLHESRFVGLLESWVDVGAPGRIHAVVCRDEAGEVRRLSYRAVQPPSTMNICPSTYVDRGESRNTMVGASSSGPSILPRGVFSRIQRS